MLWKDVEGYEGFYQVSDCGLIKSVKRYVPHNGTLRLIKERILKPSKDKDGYLFVTLQKHKTKKTLKIHRIVAIAFYGKSNLVVNHKDTNKLNNSKDNLEFVTVEYNNHHARKNIIFNVVKGKNHYAYRLTDEIKREIIGMKKSRVSNKIIAEKFKIHENTIYKILKN